MVAIVAGNGLGLFNTSLNILGGTSALGQSVLGQGGARSYVNAATGNLVLQMQDEQLAGRGLDLFQLRTYNSQGQLNDGDGDGWRLGYESTVRLTAGTANKAGSQVTRTDGDGHETIYTFVAARNEYVSTEGDGAHDTLSYSNASGGQWTWADGSAGRVETYSKSTAPDMIGLLVKVTDTQSGNTVALAYDTSGRLTSVKDTASGQELVLTYATFSGRIRLQRVETRALIESAGGAPTGTLGGLVKQVEYGYDASGRLTTVTTDLTPSNTTDNVTYVTSYTYDGASSRVASIRQGDGTSVFFTYYADGKVATVKDSSSPNAPVQLSFSYGTNVTTVTDGNGQIWTYKYDGVTRQLTEVTLPGVAGQQLTTKFEYDADGNVVKVTDAQNRSITYGYDARGNRTLERDHLGNTVTRTFNAANQVLTETRYKTPDADGAGAGQPSGGLTTRYVYDSSSRLRFIVSAEGRVTENRYESYGLLTQTRQYTAATYDVSALAETVSPSEAQLNGWVSGLAAKSQVQITKFDYDLRGQVSRQTSYASADATGAGVLDGQATVTEFTYDAHGALLQTIAVRGANRDQRTVLTSYGYDGLGRMIASTSANGTQTTAYDGVNRKVVVTNSATGLVEARSYDTRGRLLSVSFSGDNSTRETKYVYDNADQLRMVEDAQGGRRYSFFDAAGRLEYTVDATGAVARFEYNAAGQLTRQTRYATQISQASMAGWYVAGVVGKATLTIGTDVIANPTNDRITSYGYDAAGRLETVTDAANVVTTTKYDGLSRVTMTQTGDRVSRNLYDKDSRLVGTVDALGYLTEYKYDAAGRVIETVRYSERSANAADVTAPVWIGVTNQSVTGNQPFEYRVPAYDADGDTLTYSVVGTLPSWLTLDTTSATPVLKGTPPAAQTSYSVTLRAADGRGKTSDVTFKVTVGNTAPTWAELPDSLLIVNSDEFLDSNYRLILPQAVDSDPGITYSILSTLPAGVAFNAATREFVFEGRQTRGVYTITARATDAQGLSVDRSFTLTIARQNAPSDKKWSAVLPQAVYVGAPFSMTLPPAEDLQGQPLSYSFVGALPSWLSFDAGTRKLSVTGPIPAGTSFQTVEFKATNATGGDVRLSFGLSIRSEGPTWTTLPPLESVAGTALNFVVPAAGGQGLTYSIVSGLPAGLSFNATTRTITGASTAVGFYTIVLRATDASGQSTDRTISMQIRSSTAPIAQTPGSDQLAAWRPTNTAGLRTRMFYDGLGRVVGAVDERGFLTETLYDDYANAQLVKRYLTAVTIGASDTLAALKNRAGTAQTTAVAMDGFGRVLRTTAVDGTQTRNEYDAAGRLVRVVAADGWAEARGIRTRYNAFGEVTGTLGGAGDATLGANPTQAQIDAAIAQYGMRNEYDALGRVVRTIDANGNKTLYYYDRENRLSHTVSVIGQAGNDTLQGEVSETVYDAFGQVAAVRRYAARLQDADMDLLLVRGGGGSAHQLLSGTTTFLDRIAALATVMPGLNQVTAFEYDRRGLVVKATDAEGFVTQSAYDIYGQLAAQVRDILQGKRTATQYDYDLRGALLAQTSDVGGANFNVRLKYDAFGRVIQSIDGAGRITGSSYEDSGRTIVVTDPLNRTARTEYDAFGRMLKVYDAFGQPTQYVYDDVARRVTMTTPEGVQVITTSTRLGETLSVQDGRGTLTEYAYDKNGQVTQVKRAGQVIATSSYDNSGRLFESRDARGTVTRFTYDQLNRVFERAVDPSGLNLRTRYEFNALGQQFQVTEAVGTAAERLTTYAYDRKGQLTRMTVDPNGLKLTTDYGYDGAGNTVRLAQGTSSAPNQRVSVYEFDALGRRVKEVIAPSAVFGAGAAGTRDITTQYRYDAAGQVSRVIDANGNSTWYVYDAAGQQTHTINALGEVSENEYDANGRVIQSLRYVNRLSAATIAGFGDAIGTFAPPAAHVQDQRVFTVYDKDGRVRFMVQADNGTSSTAWNISESRYDANGNVIETRRYDKWLQDARINAIDTAASPGISVSEMQAELATLGYNDSDASSLRLVQRTRFAYDALDRLRFTVDALGGVSESVYDAAGNVITTRRYAVRPALTGYTETTIASAIAAANLGNDASNQVSHFAYDAAGRLSYSVQVLSPGANGQHLVSKQEYDALGQTVKATVYATALGLTAFSKEALDAATAVASVKNHQQNRISALAYDAAGRVVYSAQVQTISAQGVAIEHLVTRQEYDALGQVVKSTAYANAAGALADYRAATIAGAISTNGSADRSTSYVYDAAGRTRFVVAADRSLSETVYDAAGQVIETRRFNLLVGNDVARSEAALSELRGSRAVGDGVTRGEKFAYDRAGRVLKTTDAKGYSEENVYNGVGDRIKYTDKKGAVWAYTYDRLGRVFIRFAPAVLMKLSSDPVDAAPQLRAREDRFYYDALGNLETVAEGVRFESDVRTTRYNYDTLGRLTITTLPGYYDPATGKVEKDNAPGRFRREVQVTYDALGNAVRTRMRNSAEGYQFEYKTYDTLGRVVHEVDASSHVTTFAYTTFGEQQQITRHSLTITGAPTNDGYNSYWTASQVAAKVAGDAAARTVAMSYDNLGRKTEVRQPTAQNYHFTTLDPTLVTDQGPQYNGVSAQAVTRYEYNTFNEVYVERAQIDTSHWRETWHHYDSMGREVSTANLFTEIVDGDIHKFAYLTTREYDALGNLSRAIEYVKLGYMNASSMFVPPTPEADAKDRITGYTYNAVNQLESIQRYNIRYTRWNVSLNNGQGGYEEVVKGRNEGVTVQGMDYDANGNVTRQTSYIDGGASWTSMEYNALDQLVKVVEPSRYTAQAGQVDPFSGGQVVSNPQTSFTLDAFGNVVMTERNAGPYLGAGATLITRQSYDHAGNAVSSTDARGNTKYRQFDYAGRVIRETQSVNVQLDTAGPYGGNGQLGSTTHTIERRYAYDAQGRQVAVLDVFMDGATSTQSGQRSVFNAFGEVTGEYRTWGQAAVAWNGTDAVLDGMQSAVVASYKYDQADHLIEKTAGDGLTKYFYNLLGQVTRQEQRGDNSEADSTFARITETGYDLLGRAVIQRLPTFRASFVTSDGNGMFLKTVTPLRYQWYDRWNNVHTRQEGAYVDQSTGQPAYEQQSTYHYEYNHDNQVIAEELPESDATRSNGTTYRAHVTHQIGYDMQGRAVLERDVVQNPQAPLTSTVLRTRTKRYDASGQLMSETDATGVKTSYAYDIHGNRVGVRNSLGTVFVSQFDANGNVEKYGVLRQANGENYYQGAANQTAPVVRWLQLNQYDQANRRYATADDVYADGSVVVWSYTKHDERGLVRATSKPGGTTWLTTSSYDVLGDKTQETTDGYTKSWGYRLLDSSGNAVNDYSVGRLDYEVDGFRNDYHYNDFGQVAKIDFNAGWRGYRTFSYHLNGLLFRTNYFDYVEGWTTKEFEDILAQHYTVKGEIAQEILTSQSIHRTGVVQKTTYTQYDEQGRMKRVWTPAGGNNGSLVNTLQYRYDELSNVRNIGSAWTKQSGGSGADNLWYTYDAEGRLTRDQGELVGGAIVKGTQITYDALGRRATTSRLDRAGVSEQRQWDAGDGADYGPDGTYERDYRIFKWDSVREESYAYDDLGQLKTISARFRQQNVTQQQIDKDWIITGGSTNGYWQTTYGAVQGAADFVGSYQLVDSRAVISARGEVSARETWELADSRYAIEGARTGYTYTGTSYFPSGGIQNQSTLGKTANGQSYAVHLTYQRNDDGSVKSYTYEYRVDDQIVYTDEYKYTYNSTLEGQRRETALNVYRGDELTHKTLSFYDSLGRKQREVATDFGDDTVSRTRLFSYDNQDRVYSQFEAVNKNNAPQTQGTREHFFANGRQVGMLGSGSLDIAQFSFAYTPISAAYPAMSPGSYVVRSGDTLARIAQAVWGDSSLWYLIADANSLTFGPDATLPGEEVGKTYRIPNVVTNLRHSATAFQPYNPASIVSTLTPNPAALPAPPAAECVSTGQLLSMAVIIAATALVTAVTAGAATAVMPAALGPILSGAIAGGVGAAAGSIAGQGVAIGLGQQEDFSWGQVGVAAAGGLLSGGISGAVPGGSTAARLGRATANLFANTGMAAVAGGSFAHPVDMAFSMANAAWGQYVPGNLGSAVGPITSAALTGDWNRIASAAVGALTGVAIDGPASWMQRKIEGLVRTQRFNNLGPDEELERWDAMDRQQIAQEDAEADFERRLGLLRGEVASAEKWARRGALFGIDMNKILARDPNLILRGFLEEGGTGHLRADEREIILGKVLEQDAQIAAELRDIDAYNAQIEAHNQQVDQYNADRAREVRAAKLAGRFSGGADMAALARDIEEANRQVIRDMYESGFLMKFGSGSSWDGMPLDSFEGTMSTNPSLSMSDLTAPYATRMATIEVDARDVTNALDQYKEAQQLARERGEAPVSWMEIIAIQDYSSEAEKQRRAGLADVETYEQFSRRYVRETGGTAGLKEAFVGYRTERTEHINRNLSRMENAAAAGNLIGQVTVGFIMGGPSGGLINMGGMIAQPTLSAGLQAVGVDAQVAGLISQTATALATGVAGARGNLAGGALGLAADAGGQLIAKALGASDFEAQMVGGLASLKVGLAAGALGARRQLVDSHAALAASVTPGGGRRVMIANAPVGFLPAGNLYERSAIDALTASGSLQGRAARAMVDANSVAVRSWNLPQQVRNGAHPIGTNKVDLNVAHLRSSTEAAGVLAHEIEHVLQNSSAARYNTDGVYALRMELGAMAVQSRVDPGYFFNRKGVFNERAAVKFLVKTPEYGQITRAAAREYYRSGVGYTMILGSGP